jgi:hypothetical protein
MNIAFLIGRIIFATFWLVGSFNHFKNLKYISEYAKARGTPSPKTPSNMLRPPSSRMTPVPAN